MAIKRLSNEELRERLVKVQDEVADLVTKEGKVRWRMMEEIDRIIELAKFDSGDAYIAADIGKWYDRQIAFGEWTKRKTDELLYSKWSQFTIDGSVWHLNIDRVIEQYNYAISQFSEGRGKSLKYNGVIEFRPYKLYQFFKFLSLVYDIELLAWDKGGRELFEYPVVGKWIVLNNKISYKLYQNGKVEVKGL